MIRFALLFFMFVALISETSQAQSSDPVLDIREVESKSGIKAWMVEDTSVPVIALNFGFRGLGSTYDQPNKQGLALMVARMMTEGAGDMDAQAFQKALQDDVISLSFSSSRDGFTGSLKTLAKNQEKAFDLLRLALTQPRFDEEPLERVRNRALARVKSSLSDPEWIAARLLNDKVFEGHPYAQNSGGTLTTLQNIRKEDLEAFTKNFSKDRIFISIAGDLEPSTAGPIIEQIFGDLPETSDFEDAPETELQNPGKTFAYKMDIPQTIILKMQPGISRTDPNYQTAQIMNFVLGSSGFGSRLTETIREERGLTYGIYSSFVDYIAVQGLTVSTSTKNENVSEMNTLINQEWNKMIEEHIIDEELEDAKSFLIGSLPLSLTSTDRISSILLSIQMDGLPVDYLDQRQHELKAVTKEDVKALAKELLDPFKFTSILVGQPEGVKIDQSIEEIPNVE